MTSELAQFGARLCEFITSSTQAGRHEEMFDALARELFRLQFDHNTAYRQICEAQSAVPDVVQDWTQIPAVPTAAFKELELTCLSAAKRSTVFHSSGTSGQLPSRHFHNAESLAIYEASLWPWFAQHLLTDLKGDVADIRLVILSPPPAQVPHSSLVHMFDTVRRQLGAKASLFTGRVDKAGSWQLDFGSAIEVMERSQRDQRPILLLGTAFSFVHLVDTLEQMKLQFRLPPSSRVMETGGYKGRSRSLPKAELHKLINQRFGISGSHIVCEYGMSELSSQAYDRKIQLGDHILHHPKERENVGGQTLLSPLPGGEGQGEGKRAVELTTHSPVTRHFRFPPWARVQIISPETGRQASDGETGLIRVFDLANVFSVLAVQTEDLGVRRGDGFQLLGRAPNVEPRGCSLMVANS